MKVQYLTFEQIHNKRNIGSTRLRVHNLLKYWPEASIYKYAQNSEVMIYQKVYTTQDYKFQAAFEGVQILDICDPDWMEGAMIKETLNNIDGVTCPTEPMAEFLRQYTDKPVRVIPDRHDTEMAPAPKAHKGTATKVVWFGYKQNAELLQFAVPTFESLGLELMVVSNVDPMVYNYANDPQAYKDKYIFKVYSQDTIFENLQKNDVCVLPAGTRPQDFFKSDNKTTLAWIAGLPVARDGDELRALLDEETRAKEAKEKYDYAMKHFDVKLSVNDMKEFIEELRNGK